LEARPPRSRIIAEGGRPSLAAIPSMIWGPEAT
jgi:hypothetical protein